MSKLGDHLVAELTGGRGAPAGDFIGQARQLVQLAGSQRRAAQLAGVDRRTLQRWFQRERQGQPVRPRPGTAAKVGTGLRRAMLSPTRPTDATFHISVTDRADGRHRELSARQLRLATGTMDRAAEVWVRTGDPEAVAVAFLGGVGDRFYQRWLTPARGDRVGAGAPSGGGALGAGAGGAFDEGDQEVPLGDEDEDEDEGEYDPEDIPEDAWDEFYEDVYDNSMVPDDDDYGADP